MMTAVDRVFYKKLAEKIAQIRKSKKISQEKLASLSEVDRTYITRIENAKANPTVKVLNKICRALKIKLSKLFKGIPTYS